MNDDGITIKSKGDIKFDAGGDVDVKGKNIKNTAKTEFRADGGTTGKLKLNGNASLDGSLVELG